MMETMQQEAQVKGRQMGGGDSTKVEEWISVKHREEVHEKIQRKVRYLLWD